MFTPPKGNEQDPRVGMRGHHAIVAGRCHPLRRACWGLAWWPSECGNPDNWVTWWVMDGGDDRGRLCAMEAKAGLNAQIEHLQSNCNVPLEDGTVLGYEVGMTGDGKGLQVANYSPDGKCWSYDHESLEPVEGLDEQVRWGALLQAIPPPGRVGN